MKIIKSSRGEQIIEIQKGQILRLLGEPTVNPNRFYVYMFSFEYWYQPEGQKITLEERTSLLKKLEEEYGNLLIFEDKGV